MSEPVVRIGARVITHEAVKLAAARTAGALQALGVGPGDRVAVVMRNDPDFLMISAACGLIGAIPVPANWHWRGDELRHVFAVMDRVFLPRPVSRYVARLVAATHTSAAEAPPLVKSYVGYGASPRAAIAPSSSSSRASIRWMATLRRWPRSRRWRRSTTP